MTSPELLVDESLTVLRRGLVAVAALATGLLVATFIAPDPLALQAAAPRASLACLALLGFIAALAVPRLRIWVDRERRELHWQKRQWLHLHSHRLSIEPTLAIGIVTHPELNESGPGHRVSHSVVLDTEVGPLPLSLLRFPDRAAAEAHVAPLRAALGALCPTAPSGAAATGDLETWLRQGGPFEAIRQLRQTQGLTLEQATQRVREHQTRTPPTA